MYNTRNYDCICHWWSADFYSLSLNQTVCILVYVDRNAPALFWNWFRQRERAEVARIDDGKLWKADFVVGVTDIYVYAFFFFFLKKLLGDILNVERKGTRNGVADFCE